MIGKLLELLIHGEVPAAPVPPHEIRRIAAVQKLRLLGTPAEERFDKISRLARRMFASVTFWPS
jgi:hypothetical protein